jgi:tetratricopeptide (TPR) repeat protein
LLKVPLAKADPTVIPLPPDPGRHFAFSRGYFELGMHEAAEEEWKSISEPLRATKPALVLGIEIARKREKWRLMLQRTKLFRDQHPEGADGWLLHSFAARRARSLDAAYTVLAEALREHPEDALVNFNLGCYACLLGKHEEALVHVQRALSIDKKLAEAAVRDPDLKAIRDRIHGSAPR